MCAERGVFFTYVDLRWGISTEQSTDGKTIAICLKEVSHPCRQLFFQVLTFKKNFHNPSAAVKKEIFTRVLCLLSA
jgi:hypothetical protein